MRWLNEAIPETSPTCAPPQYTRMLWLIIPRTTSMKVSLSIPSLYTELHLSALSHRDWLYSTGSKFGGSLDVVIFASACAIMLSVAY